MRIKYLFLLFYKFFTQFFLKINLCFMFFLLLINYGVMMFYIFLLKFAFLSIKKTIILI